MATLELDGTLLAEKDNNNKIIGHVDQLSEATSGGGIQFNSATILQKLASDPANPVEGQLYYNTTNGIVKNWDGTKWLNMSNKFNASGGTESIVGNYKYHTYTSSGTFTPEIVGNIEYLIVAGGGGGGGVYHAGGGGAGGLLNGTISVTAQDYTITIGSGGQGGAASFGGVAGVGSNGSNSTAFG